MKIGDKVVLDEDLTLGGKIFLKGEILTVINLDDIRGYDLMRENGDKIYECRFLKIKSLNQVRDEKLSTILN
jgi:hypothetical protein